MNKENVVYVHNGMLVSHEGEWNYDIHREMFAAEDCHSKQIPCRHTKGKREG